MLWIGVVLVVYILAIGGLFTVIGKKSLALDRVFEQNLETVKLEQETKEKLFIEIGNLTLGLVTPEKIEKLENNKTEIEENIRAEQGRLTITEAELEAVDTRLRELEELKRELEVSNMDAVKELEMLRSQERDIAAQNDAVRNQINAALDQVDILLDQLSNSAEAVEKLTDAKNELVNAEKKCSYYEEQIAIINNQYMALKKAYDALDIEYAQLYEKQQLAADA